MAVFLLGSDQRVVRCARVSFAKDEEVDRERDIKLIKFLFENRHASLSLDNFITLRTHPHAQKEIRELALAIKDMVGYRGWDRTMRL
jgi:thymidylate synthase ThyX